MRQRIIDIISYTKIAYSKQSKESEFYLTSVSH